MSALCGSHLRTRGIEGNLHADLHWSQTLDFYHLYFVIELWCWMAQIGNVQPLDKLVLDLERFSAV